MPLRRSLPFFVLLLGIVLYGVAVSHLRAAKPSPAPELLVALPRFAQVAIAGGDRHLAANLAGFRVLVASTMRMRPEDYAVQARLQRDIAWFNPAHEDNYYIAAAILPWSGHVDAAQEVLQRAGDRRTFDWQPLFYRGFGHYYFLKDPARGAQLLLDGVPRAMDQQDAWALQNLAARWIERGYDGRTAASMVGAMAKSSPSGAFRNYLNARSERIRILEDLRDAAKLYRERTGRPLERLEDLVDARIVDSLPSDPLGVGFAVGSDGVPAMKTGR